MGKLTLGPHRERRGRPSLLSPYILKTLYSISGFYVCYSENGRGLRALARYVGELECEKGSWAVCMGIEVPVVGDDGRGDQQELDGPGHDGP